MIWRSIFVCNEQFEVSGNCGFRTLQSRSKGCMLDFLAKGLLYRKAWNRLPWNRTITFSRGWFQFDHGNNVNLFHGKVLELFSWI